MASDDFQTALQKFIPKVRGVPIVANIERVLQPATDFIRGNPIVSTAAIGAGVTGLVAGVAAIVRRRKAPKRKIKRKKVKKKTKRGRRRDRMFRSKQKHELAYVRRKRRAGKKITRPRYKTKKRSNRKQKRFIKGSAEAKRFMAKLRRMRK